MGNNPTLCRSMIFSENRSDFRVANLWFGIMLHRGSPAVTPP
jgi:hypothetical protein